ncbi:MAG: type IX secretion system sortase PorU, partial [Chitinophagales bacterium]
SKFGYLPYYETNVRLPYDGNFTVTLSDLIYESSTISRGRIETVVSDKIKSDPVILTEKGYDRGKPVALISILPFRKNSMTGLPEKLISFRYEISVSPSPVAILRGNDYAAHSVLATGTWYKIGVTEDGIHKIDKSFLQKLGIDVTSIDPRNIRIYGNGGGMLPEANSTFRYDDLQENAIEVSGEADGHFDDGDYILFYAQGPDRWKYDSTAQHFYRIKNVYTDTTYYFITADLGTGKRVADLPSSEQQPNKFITLFDDYQFHEEELENFLSSGRNWYGEAFEFQTTQTFPFNFPNLNTSSPVKVVVDFVGKSLYGSNTVDVASGGNTFMSTPPGGIAKVCGDFTCPFANEVKMTGQFNPTLSSFNIDITFNRLQSDAQGWLNYIEVNAQRNLTWIGSQNNFRSVASKGLGSISQFTINNANSSVAVWDVTNPINPLNQLGSFSGNQYQFTANSDTLHEYVMFTNTEGYSPFAFGKIDNQDLHSLAETDMIIVSPAFLLPQAQEFADYHTSHDNLKVTVVDQAKIFNEFSSGASDICGIRDFVRMFYKRANGDSLLMPKYLLLFGDGSYDNKGILPNNKSLILTYESPISLDPTNSYVSDDFFGLLDDNEGGNLLDQAAKVDVAVGRLTVNTVDDAEAVLNKIKIYTSPQSFGNWRNWITFVADDEDNNTHINDAESIDNSVIAAHPVYNLDKIYLDAYQQITVPGGQRYPDVNVAITNRVCAGTLIMNYIGHGGVGGWAHERVLGITDIQNYTNLYKQILYVTATCEFTQYDNPAGPSAGEYLLLNANGGAIG